MAKKVVQDIIVKNREWAAKAPFLERKRSSESFNAIHDEDSRPLHRPRWKSYAVLTVLVLALTAFTVGRFAKATVTITPRQMWLPVDIVLSADTRGSTGLALKTLELSREASSRVVATDATHIESYATAKIVIYNAFNSSPQTLVGHATNKKRQTRFETDKGKIYRIHKSIVVPGMRGTTPGEVEATIYADKPGEEYNGGLADFTIPGFKGTPRFNGFYARSKTPLTGGFSGVALALSSSDVNSASEELAHSLRTTLIKSTHENVPSGFTLYKDAVRVVTNPSENNPKGGERVDDALITMRGEATGYLLSTDDLISKIVKDNSVLFENTDAVSISNVDELQFAFIDVAPDKSSISFTLSGKGHFVWKTDENVLLNELRKTNKDSYASVFEARPSIKNAKISFSPSWWRWLPKSDSRVEFKEILENDSE